MDRIYDPIELTKLRQLIESKKKYRATLPEGNRQLPYLTSEINTMEAACMLMEELLTRSDMGISELNRWIDAKMLEVRKLKVSKEIVGSLFYFQHVDSTRFWESALGKMQCISFSSNVDHQHLNIELKAINYQIPGTVDLMPIEI